MTHAKPAIPVISVIPFKTVHLAMSVILASHDIHAHPAILVNLVTLAKPVTIVNIMDDHDS